MTTAAIASQPVQITTTLTNQLAAPKIPEETDVKDSKDIHPAAILEKSQKTLETIQKTVNEATEEIHKTITENLTDLKTLEQDIQKADCKEEPPVKEKPPMAKKESARKLQEVCQKIASEATIVERMAQEGRKTPKESLSKQPSSQTLAKITIPESIEEVESNNNDPPKEMPPVNADVSVVETNNNNPVTETVNNNLGDEASEEKVSERAISALPEVELESGNFQKSPAVLPEMAQVSPETAKSTNGNGSSGEADEASLKEGPTPGRCKCSTCCLPCRRCLCCRKKDNEPPLQPLRDSVETVNEKSSRWNCCKRKKKDKEAKEEVKEEKVKKKRDKKVEEAVKSDEDAPKSQNCCRACLNRLLCCRSTNKIESQRMPEPEAKKSKCCSCLPCRRERKKSDASTASTWAERQPSDTPLEPKAPGCCSRFWRCLCCGCCRRKEDAESRRTSLNSKKPSIAPPPAEKPKLDLSLVEHTSLMKAAIPVMHICLAWFCLICNCLVPGLGTVFSGFFCLCLGTPRFSQHDGFRARIGTFLINIIVGAAQAFTVLFCLVGWGWSIWWGTIMVRLARKRKKLRKAQRDEEAAEAATISSRSQAPVLPPAGASPAAGATDSTPAADP
ncbi:protein stum isoform X2 [Phlebotomus argentipes]|uniref:protein stum isoform X2 n=1 Tax=Phlebotomus argentipes TaxID=94469 RepID=UPI00289328C3|nr:protein stum isoform X2 [Phlebotomus argentipes]